MEENQYGIDKELVFEFVDESEELLNKATNLFIALEANPDNREAIDTVFRALHTIKGNSAFFNLLKVKSLAHVMEDLMNTLRDGKASYGKEIADVLILGIDNLKEMMTRVREGKPEVLDDLAFGSLVERVTVMVTGVGKKDPGLLWQELDKKIEIFKGVTVSFEPEALAAWEGVLAGVQVLRPGAIVKQAVAVKKKVSPSIPASVPAEPVEASSVKVGKTMRVSESSIDVFLDFVGELVIVAEMYGHMHKRFAVEQGASRTVADFKKNNEMLNTLTIALQKSVLEIRRVPVKNLTQMAPKIIRDVTSVNGKQVRLELHGEDLFIDKSLLESLEAPVVHMLRNAGDHGVEAPEERKRKGKGPEGRVTVDIQEMADEMLISIADDGAGIDQAAVKAKAVKMGLLTEEKALRLTEQETYQLLFEPGFSTAKTVTNVSGRGVGMDVVKRNLQAIGGRIVVESIPGKGSKFILRFPKAVCVKIIDGFIISVADQRFILPMNLVGESFQVLASDLLEVSGGENCLLHHGRILPVRCLDRMLGLERQGKVPSQWIGVMLETASPAILLTDEVLGIQRVVIKNIDGLPVKSSMIVGGAILGDERVAIVLDVEKI